MRRAGVDGARARFGVPEVLTTRTLARGACALSQPLLLKAASARGAQGGDPSILPSVALATREIGIGWESYGITRADTVTVSIEVRAESIKSLLGSIGRTLGIGKSDSQSLVMQWTEPNGPALTREIVQSVPTLDRRLVLNLNQLKRGTYMLQLQIDTPSGCHAVSDARRFEVK